MATTKKRYHGAGAYDRPERARVSARCSYAPARAGLLAHSVAAVDCHGRGAVAQGPS